MDAPEGFNAIGSCIKKEYVYKIMNTRIRDPFLQRRVCFYPAPLDFERLAAAGAAFEGTHDFAAVRSVGTETKTTVRTVYWCRAERQGELITIAVCADGFLYNMVRAIVGHHGLRLARQAGAGGHPRPAGDARQAPDRPHDAARRGSISPASGTRGRPES